MRVEILELLASGYTITLDSMGRLHAYRDPKPIEERLREVGVSNASPEELLASDGPSPNPAEANPLPEEEKEKHR